MEQDRKYRLMEKPLVLSDGSKAYRIQALKDFSDVKAGDPGGFVGSADNLSQEGDCWVYSGAYALDDSRISGNAMIRNGRVCSHAQVSGNVCMTGGIIKEDAQVSGDVRMMGGTIAEHACVSGNVVMKGQSGVRDDASVSGYTLLQGNACVQGHASVSDSVIKGMAVVDDNARVMNVNMRDKSIICGNADVTDNRGVMMSGSSIIQGDAVIRSNIRMGDRASIEGGHVTMDMDLCGNACIRGDGDYIALGEIDGSARAFRDNAGHMYVAMEGEDCMKLEEFCRYMEEFPMEPDRKRICMGALEQAGQYLSGKLTLSDEDLNFGDFERMEM